jgi:hypothetical protein
LAATGVLGIAAAGCGGGGAGVGFTLGRPTGGSAAAVAATWVDAPDGDDGVDAAGGVAGDTALAAVLSGAGSGDVTGSGACWVEIAAFVEPAPAT